MSELKRQEKYEGTVVQVGNSRGMRLPAGFFRAHPEFSGKVQVTVVANGSVLVSARPTSKRKPKEDEVDPVVTSFLQFLDKQMTEHPEGIVAHATEERHVSAQSGGGNGLIGALTPADSAERLAHEGLARPGDARNPRNEVNVGTADNENIASGHGFLLRPCTSGRRA